MPDNDLIARLAQQIDAAKRAERFLVNAEDVAALRRRGASELHAICAEFAASVNNKLGGVELELSPPEFGPDTYQETVVNLLQLGFQGRVMQIAFEAPAGLFSTDKFLIPYVLEGEIRTFNQRMLERLEVRSQMLFYCVEGETATWRFFDWRTMQTGPLGRDLLATLMGRLF